MADVNSLTYFIYSLLTLAAHHEAPTTDPSLKAWEIGSEPPATEAWNQEPDLYTAKFDPDEVEPRTSFPRGTKENCPRGEKWSDCDAGCQRNCENVGEDIICRRMCIPGCVCDEPGTVRGPDGTCIAPPLCPSADVDPDEVEPRTSFPRELPVTRYGEEKTDFPSSYTDAPPVTENAQRFKWTLPDYPYFVKDDKRPPVQPLAEQILNDRLFKENKVDPDEVDPSTPLPLRGECPRSESISCEKHCERNCSNWDREKIICPPFCNRGCVCNAGLVRGPDGHCIKSKMCPKESEVTHQEPQPDIDRDIRHGCPDIDACLEYCGPKMGICMFTNICVCI